MEEHHDCHRQYLLDKFSTDGTFETFNMAEYLAECYDYEGKQNIVFIFGLRFVKYLKGSTCFGVMTSILSEN